MTARDARLHAFRSDLADARLKGEVVADRFVAGRPARISAFNRVLEYLRDLGDAVWVARRRDFARFWRAAYPVAGE